METKQEQGKGNRKNAWNVGGAGGTMSKGQKTLEREDQMIEQMTKEKEGGWWCEGDEGEWAKLTVSVS